MTVRSLEIKAASAKDQKLIDQQNELLGKSSSVFNSLFDALIDAQDRLATENVDDLYNIGEMKTEVAEMVKGFQEWRQANAGSSST